MDGPASSDASVPVDAWPLLWLALMLSASLVCVGGCVGHRGWGYADAAATVYLASFGEDFPPRCWAHLLLVQYVGSLDSEGVRLLQRVYEEGGSTLCPERLGWPLAGCGSSLHRVAGDVSCVSSWGMVWVVFCPLLCHSTHFQPNSHSTCHIGRDRPQKSHIGTVAQGALWHLANSSLSHICSVRSHPEIGQPRATAWVLGCLFPSSVRERRRQRAQAQHS